VSAFRKTLAGAVVLGLACAAAAQLTGYQPALAAPAASRADHGQVPLAAVKRPARELGAAVDLYTYPGQDFTTATAAEIAYLKALHANSVMVSFPFFISGRGGSTVFAKKSTPTPAQLSVLARAATKAGLFLTLRPLMDQTSIGESRASWKPRNQKAWFASYRKFLLPYAQMAHRAGVARFYIGAEFSKFQGSRLWTPLDNAVRKAFRGTLVYANNGKGVHPGIGGKGVQLSVDAYPNLGVGTNPATARLTRAWKAYDQRLPARTVLSEVGISGVKGAFLSPWQHHWPHPKMDVSVQVRWFTAACRAAVASHSGGIYFWAIGFGAPALVQKLDAQHQGAWENGPAEKAVAACYQRARGIR
jgi:hypothetical protein